jgi:hypothetical protein
MADFQLIPGGVGLNIIDSFYSQTPMVTINNAGHGPEIFYIENNKNGIISEDDLNKYSNIVIGLINNENKLNRLKMGCKESAGIYTIENMADSFYNGIINILGKN